MLLFPIDVERLKAEHGVDKLYEWKHYPPAWKVIAVLSVVAALVNWGLITYL